MQINSTTNTAAYTTTVKETSKTQEIQTSEEKKFDMTQPFDIDSFTFEDYKAIDAKDLREWIVNSDLTKEEETKADMLAQMTTMTDDDTLNRVLFNKTNESYDKTGESLFSTVFIPLADMRDADKRDYYLGMAYRNSMNPEGTERFKNDSNNGATASNGGEKSTSNFHFSAKDMISDMQNFQEFYNNLDSDNSTKGLMGDVSDTFQIFDEILAEYTKLKDEQNAALDAYTRNTKQNPIAV